MIPLSRFTCCGPRGPVSSQGLRGSVALVGRVHGVIAGRAQIRW